MNFGQCPGILNKYDYRSGESDQMSAPSNLGDTSTMVEKFQTIIWKEKKSRLYS